MTERESTEQERADLVEEAFEAKDELAYAKSRYRMAIDALYPVGSPVTWIRGGHRSEGTVRMTGYGPRILVHNEKTGREYWIDAYCALETEEAASTPVKEEQA